MASLDDLLLSRVREILGIIAEDGVSHKEVSSVARHVQADYHGRFLVELLQNANDQVVKAGKKDGTVEIYRTATALAVSNLGLPFDPAGIRALTALGLSEKDPNILIGNKGIGFKAVFEVAESPEVYSAPVEGGSLTDGGATAFTISQNPFAGDVGAARLRALAELAVSEKHAEAEKLGDNAVELLIAAVHDAAPFKFPIEIPTDQRDNRFSEFDFDPTAISTLMVLPLRPGEKTQVSVNRALDEIQESGGSFILFLAGVSKVRITDSVRGHTFSLSRETVGKKEPMERGEKYSVRRILTGMDEDEPDERMWHVVETVFGGEKDSEAASALRDASRDLPGDGQSHVNQAPIAVALPKVSSTENLLLGASGKFCIGLPTKVLTGTPAWIHSHFFGKISRQDLDLDYKFNELLFEEAIRLHGTLVERLKRDEKLERRILATLAYERGKGPLADALFRSDGDAFGSVILAADGVAFVRATQLLVPEVKWGEIIEMIFESCPLEAFHLPHLPHRSLLSGAHELLVSLTRNSGTIDRDVFLKADEGKTTPLEYAAKAHRHSGHQFWKDFLEYSIELFKSDYVDELGSLKILPVGADRLVSSLDGVFLQPATSNENLDSDPSDDEELPPPEVERTSLEALPKEVFDRLNFLDEKQIRVRLENGRALTSLASRLAPDKGKALISRPRKVDMILGAIVPALNELECGKADLAYGLQLLGIAGQWMSDIGEDDAKKVQHRIRVPVALEQDNWTWKPANTCYFGEGWGCDNERLLASAYGSDSGRLLVPFGRLGLSNSKEDIETWHGVMSKLGVHSRPRLVVNSRRGVSQFRAEHWYALGIADEPKCPFEAASLYWSQYLGSCEEIRTSVGSKQSYRFSEISWIDGLEIEESRRQVVAMILKDHEHYSTHSRVRIGRSENPESMDSTIHPSLWTFAIKHEDWQCIPAESGILRPSECWLVGIRSESGQQGRFESLERVRKDVLPARALLLLFGVADIQSPSPAALIRELEKCARRLQDSASEGILLRNLVEDLYERLEKSPAVSRLDDSLSIQDRVLPLLRGGRLVAVRAGEIEIAYIIDEPDRTAFIPDFTNALVWPFLPRSGSSSDGGLLEAIRKLLGKNCAQLVSEIEIQTGFAASQGPLSLRDWLKDSGFSDPASVIVDLACLLCMRPSNLNPNGERFGFVWGRFERLKIVRGNFPGNSKVDHYYHEENDFPLLEVSEHLDRFAVLRMLWRLGGDQNLFEAYIGNSKNDSADYFFRSRYFSGREREDVEFAVESVSGERLEGVKAAILAFRLRDRNDSVSEFLESWDANRGSWEKFIAWLGEPFSGELLETALAGENAEFRSLAILEISGIEISDWQAARQALGMDRHRFERSRRLWESMTRQVTAILKTAIARRSGAELTYAKSIIESLKQVAVPEVLSETKPDFERTLSIVADTIEGMLTVPDSRAGTIIQRIVQLLRSHPKVMLSGEVKVGEVAPARDVAEYRDNDDNERTRRAIEWGMEYLRIGARLTGAEEDFGQLMAEPDLAPLSSGYWANRFSMIPALQDSLERRAPKALQIMKDRGAFRSVVDLRQLSSLFPEIDLKKSSELGPVKAVPKKVKVLGLDIEEGSIHDELIGDGSLADALTAALESESFDPTSTPDREGVENPTSVNRNPTRRRRTQTEIRERSEKTNLIGQIGELYVYKWLQKLDLPGFDQECWISSNRCPFLGCEDGDDSAGFDFQVKDELGKLTKNPNEPSVLIEVKSTSSEDDGQFILSAWEWQRAIKASKDDGEEYWIVIVEEALNAPRISQIVKDPYRLMTEAKLRFDHDGLIVKVGTLL